jgi:hypothetical protein
MLKRFTKFFIVSLILVFSGSSVLAAAQSEDAAKVSNMLLTEDKAAVMSKSDLKNMCNDQTLAMMDKKSMDKMMVMMTVDQFNMMMDNMFNDNMFKDQMMTRGTKEQWMMLSKDQMNFEIDKMMLNMTQDQMDKLTDKMMMIMTKQQFESMMTDNMNDMLTTSNALEPSQEDMMKMSKEQSMMLRYKLSMDEMMAVMTDDQFGILIYSMTMGNISKDQMLAMETKNRDRMIVQIDQMMMTMTKDQLSKVTEKMMMTLSKDQMRTMMMNNNKIIQKATTVVGY